MVVYYTSEGQKVEAVNGVNLYLERGETLGLVGETGAGKTTIAKTILRILPDPPAKIGSGDIWLEGENLLDKPESEMLSIRGGKIAMIFQDPMTALNPTITVGNQISEVIQHHNPRMSKREVVNRMHEMLEMVGIPTKRSVEYPHQFSGGMKQRVVIAIALACNPLLLLADEPTTALDVTIQAQVLDMMRELRNKMNTSMILITHDLGVVAETCDRVAVIYAGQIVESGTKRHIFKNPSHPYTNGLFGSLPNLHEKLPKEGHKRLSPIPGLPPDPTQLPQGCPFSPRCRNATEECRQGKIADVEVEPGHIVKCIKATKEGK
ncbi:MAG: ABC transporter ATP-binding protein [Lachnospiraceae bacterium]